MMNHNDGYYWWGLHMGWWILIIILVIAFAWFGWTRRK